MRHARSSLVTMNPAPGTHLGPYEIVSRIGERTVGLTLWDGPPRWAVPVNFPSSDGEDRGEIDLDRVERLSVSAIVSTIDPESGPRAAGASEHLEALLARIDQPEP